MDYSYLPPTPTYQARADPNAADVSGEPPLIEAACYGDLEAWKRRPLGGSSHLAFISHLEAI